jgi:hypothetical protein
MIDLDEMLARENIRDLMASYAMAGDMLQTEAFVAVFTEDGILESDGVPDAGAFRYAGRDALRNWMNRWAQKGDAPLRAYRAKRLRHHLSTSLIELTGTDTARALTYWTAYTDTGVDHGGVYIDWFRKTDDSWLIAHRKVRLDWRSPASLLTTGMANTR